MMLTIFRLGATELTIRWRMALVMVLVVTLPFLSYLELDVYRSGLRRLYSDATPAFLVVQSNGSMGEFYGSRLPAQMGDELVSRGARLVVPEIHTIIGSSPATAILLRGIPLDLYTQTESFNMLAGRPLQPGDDSRLAMVGKRLAEKLDISAGSSIELRGRAFRVIGVFSIGTYADHEAWISLPDAQALLNWGSDVSVYVIPAGQGLSAGDQLPDGASVVQKGDSGASLIQEWAGFFNLLKVISISLGVAAAVSLANLLWRLAWQRRRELAILRSLGFGRSALVVYLLCQGIIITCLGYGLGLLGALAVGRFTELRTAGISVQAVYSPQVLLTSLVFAGLIVLAGAVLPAWQLSRANLVGLLRDE